MSIPPSAVARVVGINVTYKNANLGQALFLPQRIAIIGQGNTASTYASTKKVVLSENEAAEIYGYGSPIHLACRQLLPANGNGIKGIPVTVYPLEDYPATGVAADGTIDATGAATAQGGGYVYIGGVKSEQIVIPDLATAAEALALVKAAIDAVLHMPATTGVIAADSLPLDAKWAGESSNDITIDISELVCEGLVFSITAFASGAVNPDVQDALDIMETWETLILNCMNYDDSDTNALYHAFGEARWAQEVKKPVMVATGCVDNYATRTAVTDADKTNKTMFLIQSTASRELPFVIAAQGLVNDIAQKMNDKPAHNYVGTLEGLQAGADIVQENYTVRDAAVKLGASTNIKVGELAVLSDIVTFYHPAGETPPAYRYPVDICRLQQIVFNLDIIQEVYRGRPLLPDDTPTDDPDAVQPKMVKTVLSNLADSLASGRSAILAESAFTKTNMTVEIDSLNPKRVNTVFPVKLSGNVEVNSTDVYFSFNFGN
jgi:phage tail sheath gpL-like